MFFLLLVDYYVSTTSVTIFFLRLAHTFEPLHTPRRTTHSQVVVNEGQCQAVKKQAAISWQTWPGGGCRSPSSQQSVEEVFILLLPVGGSIQRFFPNPPLQALKPAALLLLLILPASCWGLWEVRCQIWTRGHQKGPGASLHCPRSTTRCGLTAG